MVSSIATFEIGSSRVLILDKYGKVVPFDREERHRGYTGKVYSSKDIYWKVCFPFKECSLFFWVARLWFSEEMDAWMESESLPISFLDCFEEEMVQ